MRRVVALAPAGQQVHASSLLRYGGMEVVAWFCGTCEGSADTRIMVATATPGEGFTPPVVVTGSEDVAHWNPVLAAGPDGRIWLFFKVGRRIDTWRTFVTCSLDGRGWESPRELVPGDEHGGRGPVRQAPVHWRGAWLAGGSREFWDPPRWDCFVDVSRDGGRTWQRHDIPLDHAICPGAGCIQPWLVPDHEGGLVALVRSSGGAVFRSRSHDGLSWSPLLPTGLANNNSGIAVVRTDSGRMVCIHNPGGTNWGPRNHLVLSVSDDSGSSWEQLSVVEKGLPFDGLDGAGCEEGVPTATGAAGVVTDGRGEFSYPSALLVQNRLTVTYTWQRRAIVIADMDVHADVGIHRT